MHVKIAAPDQVIFTGEVEKITVPTEGGEITLLPNHQPLATVVKSGLACLTFSAGVDAPQDAVMQDGKMYIGLTKGMLLVDGKNVVITTSAATSSPKESEEVLNQMKVDMEAELEKIKIEGNKDDLELAMINLEKVTADLRLTKLKNVHG